MVSCCAYGCNKRSGRDKVSFHKFPADPELRALWIKAVNRKDWTPSSTSRICSVHFLPCDLNKTYFSDKVHLREHVIPSIFPAVPKYLQNSTRIPSEERVKDEELDEQFPLTAPVAPKSSIIPPPLPQKKLRTIGHLARQDELLEKACLVLEQLIEPPDNIPTIAKVWGETLLALCPQQRALAEKAVNDVLFEATQGTLHRHSVKINEDPRLGTVQQPFPNNNRSNLSTSSGNISCNPPSKDEDTPSINFND